MDDDDRGDDLARAERAARDALAATLVRHVAVLALATGATTIGLLSVLGVVVGVTLHVAGVTTLSTAVAGGTVAVLVARRPFWMEGTAALLAFIEGHPRS